WPSGAGAWRLAPPPSSFASSCRGGTFPPWCGTRRCPHARTAEKAPAHSLTMAWPGRTIGPPRRTVGAMTRPFHRDRKRRDLHHAPTDSFPACPDRAAGGDSVGACSVAGGRGADPAVWGRAGLRGGVGDAEL